jgi:hypothetical protein
VQLRSSSICWSCFQPIRGPYLALIPAPVAATHVLSDCLASGTLDGQALLQSHFMIAALTARLH